MADHMDYYHNHFRSTWNEMVAACDSNKRPKGMSIRQFLAVCEQFIHSLTFHHTLEETHIYPVLAKKMPAFASDVELLDQHKEIHKGLDILEEYIAACRSGEKELRLSELKKILDTFGKVLWDHLDDEVRELGADIMRRHWTLEEMRRLPM
jgi:hemerythrin-like domain-containing protein